MEYVYSKLVVPAFLFHNIVDHRRLNVVYFHNMKRMRASIDPKSRRFFPIQRESSTSTFLENRAFPTRSIRSPTRKSSVEASRFNEWYSLMHWEWYGMLYWWNTFEQSIVEKYKYKSWYESIYLLNYITESLLWLKKRRIFDQNFCIILK